MPAKAPQRQLRRVQQLQDEVLRLQEEVQQLRGKLQNERRWRMGLTDSLMETVDYLELIREKALEKIEHGQGLEPSGVYGAYSWVEVFVRISDALEILQIDLDSRL